MGLTFAMEAVTHEGQKLETQHSLRDEFIKLFWDMNSKLASYVSPRSHPERPCDYPGALGSTRKETLDFLSSGVDVGAEL